MAVALVAAGLGLGASPAHAQDVRGWASTTFRFVEVRPLVREVVEPGDVADDATASCVPGGDCVLYRPGDVEDATVGTQDLALTAWGLGVQGLSFTTHLRGRAKIGGDFVWPRSEDEVDAYLAYLELKRDQWRVRVGRQRTLSGLGFSGYDGGNLSYRPIPQLTAEAYGGRSLARGLAEPRNEALRGIEDYVLDQSAYLLGGFLQARLDRGTEVGLRYQREIWADRSGLISERASLDLRTDALRFLHLRGSADYDFAFDRVGKAELELMRAFPSLGLSASLEGRRYVPYFELSTIWGFFSPVAYREAMARLAWAGETVGLWGRWGWRTYGDTETPVVLAPLTDDGWRAELGGNVRVSPRWTLRARYGVEYGVGAYLSSGDASLRFTPADRFEITAHGTTFQRIEEFRLGDGRVIGGGLNFGIQVMDDIRLDGGAAVYRHDAEDGPADEIWNQTRIWSALRIDFGDDPGRPRVRLRR
jgi:hypothetical protein